MTYSCAWVMKASTFIWSLKPTSRPPPAIFMNSAWVARMSWLPSSPARSADSSDFRDHSRNASLIGSRAIPARIGRALRLTIARMAAIVR